MQLFLSFCGYYEKHDTLVTAETPCISFSYSEKFYRFKNFWVLLVRKPNLLFIYKKYIKMMQKKICMYS